MSDKRVVITGMGAVTPFGVSVDSLWSGLIEGRCGLSPVTLFDTTDFSVRIGGEIPSFDATKYLDRKLVKRLDRYAQFALVACDEAVRASGLDLDKEDATRLSVIFGSGIGGLNELEQQLGRLNSKGPSKVSAFTIPKLMVNAAAGNMSIRYGAQGHSLAVSSACASATHAMGEAAALIRNGFADIVFTGGSEAALTPLALSAFASMKALSTRNDDPIHASRPFDRDRDGFVLSEGSGAFTFESLEHAEKRGAPIVAEVIGYASTCDAEHITQPQDSGNGAARTMRLAIESAGLNTADIDYINAHGTSTPLGDAAETRALHTVFGSAVKKLAISSTKGGTGHALGASGGVELIATLEAMRFGVIPPTINLDNAGDGCDLDYCANTPRDRKIDVAMSNSFGFGGHNACIVVRRFA